MASTPVMAAFKPFAAHISDRNDNTAVRPRKDLVEVPANFLAQADKRLQCGSR